MCLCVSQDAAHEISPSSDENSASESIYSGPCQFFFYRGVVVVVVMVVVVMVVVVMT